MNLNGGYIIINKDDANIYSKANEALTNGKPILWYENDTTCYYIDTIALSGDDIVLTKGGKTITITDENAVSESGNIQNHLYTIYLHGEDENNDAYYIYITLSTSLEINNDNVSDILLDLISKHNGLSVTGYDVGNSDVIVNLVYETTQQKYYANISSDSSVELTSIDIIEVTKLI